MTPCTSAETVCASYVLPAPDVSEAEKTDTFRLLSLDALVRMKLMSFRDRDRVHLRDLIEVGLVDDAWRERVPEALQSRLREPETWLFEARK